MAESSSSGYVCGGATCNCQLEAVVKTSWTEANPGRRFLGCRNYGIGEACRYFSWVDPPVQPRARKMINGLLRKVDDLERENAALRKERRRKSFCVGVLGTVVVVLLAIILTM